MNSRNLPHIELASLIVGDTDGPKIKEVKVLYDVLLEVTKFTVC